MRSPEILKCCSERWVCAPHSRSAGTSMGPKVSFSIRVFTSAILIDDAAGAPDSLPRPWNARSSPTTRRASRPRASPSGAGILERARTVDLLSRHLPHAARAHPRRRGQARASIRCGWPACGYDVRLLDPVPLHVEQARAAAAQAPVLPSTPRSGDARPLPDADASADAVLLMGPLYHLTERVRPRGRPGRGAPRAAPRRRADGGRHLPLRVAARRPLAPPRGRPRVPRDPRPRPRRGPAPQPHGPPRLLHDRVLPPARGPGRGGGGGRARGGPRAGHRGAGLAPRATSPPASRTPPTGRCSWTCCGGSRPSRRSSR